MEILSRSGGARRSGIVSGLALFLSPTLWAQAHSPSSHALADISLEDLMNVQVVSVSRKEQKLSKTGAAVFVITQEDIRRSGAANIPDVLRMAPGVNVARVDANAWAVSIRGFNSRYSNKIVVLIDGRSVYSPAFAGVYWDQINVPLENISRIEVIRGTGGTVWGANAMNGVINIITLDSKDTQGGLLVVAAGSQESGGLAQYGGKAGKAGTWRAFGKYSNTESSVTPAGGAAADGWHALHEGFRTDLAPSARDKVMVQGDLYETGEGQTVTAVLSNHLPTVATFNDPITMGGGDLQSRWIHSLKNGSETALNVYFNHFNRFEQGSAENANTFDADFQHHIAVNGRNDLVWGLGYRVTNDRISPSYGTALFPPQRTDNLYSAFVQDEIKLNSSAWFTLGSKFEHNAYTGFEYEPSVQFVWTPTARQTVWLSASQAIRQPSRQDTDLQYHDVAIIPFEAGNFGVVQFVGKKNIQAEQVRDYEAGYRAQVTKRLSLDVAAFRGYYRHLETTRPGNPFFADTPAPPHLVVPLYLEGGARARTYGGEVVATWSITNRWELSPGYSLIHLKVIEMPPNPNSSVSAIPGDTPKHQIQLRSGLKLRANLDWDTSLFFVGQLNGGQVPGYTRLDMQLRWRVRESLEFGVTGQNLLTGRHSEFGGAFGLDYTQVRRSVLARATWKF